MQCEFPQDSILKDKRNMLHQSEQKKRREEVFSKLRKKYISPIVQQWQDFSQATLANYSISMVATKEGRKQLKQCLYFIPQHFQELNESMLNTTIKLLQLPINETTIGVIYDTLKMLTRYDLPAVQDDIWKLINAALKYINQQHGYLLIKTGLVVIGNFFTDYRSLEYLLKPNVLDMICMISSFLLQTMDKGIVQQTLWIFNNLMQSTRSNQNLNRMVCIVSQLWKVLNFMTSEMFIQHLQKIFERYWGDQETMKELMWLNYILSKQEINEKFLEIPVMGLAQFSPNYEKQILTATMTISYYTSRGFKNEDLLVLLTQKYTSVNVLAQREILIALANLFVENDNLRQLFINQAFWTKVVCHSIQTSKLQVEAIYLLYNLYISSPQHLKIIRDNLNISQLIEYVIETQKLPQQIVDFFSYN